MTRKHFEMIAGILKNFHCKGHSTDQAELIQWIAECMAHEFKNQNPRFDSARFVKACTD